MQAYQSSYLKTLQELIKENKAHVELRRAQTINEIKEHGLPTTQEIRAAVLDALDEGGSLRDALLVVGNKTRELLNATNELKSIDTTHIEKIRKEISESIDLTREQMKTVYASVQRELDVLAKSTREGLSHDVQAELKKEILLHAKAVRESMVQFVSPVLQENKVNAEKLLDQLEVKANLLKQKTEAIVEDVEQIHKSTINLNQAHKIISDQFTTTSSNIASMILTAKNEYKAVEDQYEKVKAAQRLFVKILFGANESTESLSNYVDSGYNGIVNQLLGLLAEMGVTKQLADQMQLTAKNIQNALLNKDANIQLALQAQKASEQTALDYRTTLLGIQTQLDTLSATQSIVTELKNGIRNSHDRQIELQDEIKSLVTNIQTDLNQYNKDSRVATELKTLTETLEQKDHRYKLLNYEQLKEITDEVILPATKLQIDEAVDKLTGAITRIFAKQIRSLSLMKELPAKMINPRTLDVKQRVKQELPEKGNIEFNPPQKVVQDSSEDEAEAELITSKKRPRISGQGAEFKMTDEKHQPIQEFQATALTIQLVMIKQFRAPPLSFVYRTMDEFLKDKFSLDYVLNLKCGDQLDVTYYSPLCACVPVLGMTFASPLSANHYIRLVCIMPAALFFVQHKLKEGAYTRTHGKLQMALLGLLDVKFFIAQEHTDNLRFHPRKHIISSFGPSLSEGGTCPQPQDVSYIGGIIREVVVPYTFSRHQLCDLKVRVATEITFAK